jgi:hydrogenase maturation protein HypF
MEWNLVAAEGETGSYPFEIETRGRCPEVDLRALVRAAVGDFMSGVGVDVVSGRFHNAMTEVAAAMVRGAAAIHGRHPVILTGGCFQNARLAEGIRARLMPEFDVLLHGDVPPGDGGIALGQAVVADAVTSA